MTVIALVDGNNFYASIERVFHPRLMRKPVIVLSNNDSCVVARSNEAKALGIQMGHPFFKIRDLIQHEGVHVFSSNFELYGDMSRRLMKMLERFTPSLEIYSIDEAFLDLKGIPCSSRVEYGKQIRETVLQGLGLPVSIGIAPTKTLAKVAGFFAKKIPSFDGVCDLTASSDPSPFLARLPVEEVWGIGRKYAALLKAQGIETALQLREAPLPWIRKHLSILGVRLVEELKGRSCFPLEEIPPPKKSLIVSRTLSTPTNQYEVLKEAVATFTLRGAEKLRRHQLAAQTLLVFLRTNRSHATTQYHPQIVLELAEATQHSTLLLRTALQGIEKIFKPPFTYNKAGICLMNLTDARRIQQSLWVRPEERLSPNLMKALDRINRTLGAGTPFYGACGLKRDWIPKLEKRSPRYTTRWEELFRV